MSTIDVGAGQIFSGTLNAGDTLVVEAGGQTSGATIYGTETLQPGGLSSGDTIEAGGALSGDGTSPSQEIVNDVTIAGGSVSGLYATLTGSVNFAGPGGTLILPDSLATPITGFGTGDGIEFPGAEILGAASLTVVGDAVTLHTTFSDYSVDIVGASGDNLSVIDLKNGTGLFDDVLTIVCFLAGTAIATPDGSRPIETLRAGDLVLTADGAAMPVRWLGRQTVATRFADQLRVAPIRIRAGALGDDLPVRDLLVSPDHALMVDGVFVQAGALVNTVSITREDRDMPERFTYFHVELAEHALILAEGVAAETFIDNVDRLAFDNWDEHAATAPMREMPYPRAKAHRQVPQVLRARLMARGAALCGSDVASVA